MIAADKNALCTRLTDVLGRSEWQADSRSADLATLLGLPLEECLENSRAFFRRYSRPRVAEFEHKA